MQDEVVHIRTRYDTWNTFKKDLELNLGHFLPNNLWLISKPKKPLPWSNTDMKEAFLSLLKKQSRQNLN